MRRTLILLVCLAACEGADDDTTTDEGADTDDTDAVEDLPAPAAPLAFSGDACPALGEGETSFQSEGIGRTVTVRLPDDPDGAGVLFAWHGNGDSGTNFDRFVGGSALANDLDVIAVFPEADAGGIGTDWGTPPAGDPRYDRTLFDDVLTCLDEQYGIDRRRVFTTGFSAGALWSSYLVMNRTDHLAAAVIFSGGSDGMFNFNPYNMPAWTIPVLMTHGGPSDVVTVNFQDMTNAMSSKMRRDGSTVIVCNHGMGHIVPSDWKSWAPAFLDAHRYGLDPSPYADETDPSGALPSYCSWD